MNDNELSQLMKDLPVVDDNLRDEHISTALSDFSSTSTRRSSRTGLLSVAAAVLLVVGAGIGVALSSLTDDEPVMYAEASINSLAEVPADTNRGTTKGVAPIGPCDTQYAGAQFIAIVRIGTERVAVYATPDATEPVVQLADPTTCDELAITRR